MIGHFKRIEKITRGSAFEQKKKKHGLRINPGLAQICLCTTGPGGGALLTEGGFFERGVYLN